MTNIINIIIITYALGDVRRSFSFGDCTDRARVTDHLTPLALVTTYSARFAMFDVGVIVVTRVAITCREQQ